MMKVNFCISCQKGKPWIKVKNGYFSGSVFLGDEFLTEAAIKEKFDEISTVDDIKKFVTELNGSFAVAVTVENSLIIATDRERTIPLFYEINNDVVNVYNHISMEDIKNHGLNKAAFKELDDSLFVSGNKNLAENVYGVMAGEMLEITNSGEVKKHKYNKYKFDKVTYRDKEEIYEIIDKKFIEVTKRLIRFLNGRCAVIPLSGGYDSRVIAYYLKYLGYDNVLTYTYGPVGNFEAETSKKVADFLGLKWMFVEYKPHELQKLMKNQFEELTDYYSNGVSSVNMPDLYAVYYLHNKGCIPPDSVFVPGHAFDCIAGSFILPRYVENDMVSTKNLVKDIIWKHYSEGKRKLSPKEYAYYSDLIYASFPENLPEIISSEEAFRLYQIYNIRERQAKYICASVKIYEFYGYDWFLPLWDLELVAFWEGIPLKDKYNRKLFFDFTDYKYPELMKAAPVKNPKIKGKKEQTANIIYRLFRKIRQLIYYTDTHYCFAYFHRIDVYMVFLTTRFMNIGRVVNNKMKRIIRRKIK